MKKKLFVCLPEDIWRFLEISGREKWDLEVSSDPTTTSLRWKSSPNGPKMVATCDLRSFTPKLLPIVCHNPKSSFQVHLYDKGTVFVAWLHDFHYLSILPAGALYARRRSRTGNYGYVSWKKVTSSRDYPLNVVHDKQFQLKTDISPTDWRYWIHLNAERLAYEPILNGIYKIRS